MTTEQVMNKTKTVTRRQGWGYLKVGDVVNAVEKGMGLKKGETVKKICQIRILSITEEEIRLITASDCALEGFPLMSPKEFVEMYCKANRVKPWNKCRRIEFEYI